MNLLTKLFLNDILAERGFIMNYIWYFIIYAFFGWCCEVVFAAVTRGQFVNCGMLRGPWCPIYGVGVSLVIVLLTPLCDNLAALFFGSVAITGLIELATGIILEKIFRRKWWDYSNQPFNFMGHICLKMSLLWGVASVLIMRVVQPLIDGLIAFVPGFTAYIILGAVYAVFLTDLAFTLKNTLKLKRELRLLDEMAEKIRTVSDFIGGGLYEGTDAAMKIKDKADKNIEQLRESADGNITQLKEKNAERRARLSDELEKLRERYNSEFKKSASERFSKAFPLLSAHNPRELSERIEKLIEKVRNR